ncbi:FKBP-type peptidyl-prolyl cis-trans isomerase [Actinoplanes regularis]|uniref:FKBP-type peptidyl-prolyl cis-trans isomerase n=1 Tax=Actinoplanes regularis TaxID=52697 RepID=UPI0024A52E0F|nr:FKBP-type peptidyl-prolyl cis-trans isomerase [Actinoplanes regularis]GLW28482.1 hypothetical protein Areg01_14220 [Actinoplanes regularis]
MSDRTAAAEKRRTQAIAGGLTGAFVVLALVIVYFVVRAGNDDEQPAATSIATTSAAATSATAVEPAPPPAESVAPLAGNPSLPPELAKEPEVQPGTGGPLTKLEITELVKGTGPVVKSGQTVTFNYKLIPYKGGDVIDSSWSRGEPFTSPIGAGQLIQGWDQGIPGQRVGSRIQLDVPAALAYKDQDLRFVIDILSAR